MLATKVFARQSDQGSTDWLFQRAGHATASNFCHILAVSKRGGQPLKARNDYLMRLVVERLTGEPVESASSFAMTWGTEAEPYARAEYEMLTGRLVTEAGFLRHTQHAWVGASSDGLVGNEGGIEIKCPHNSALHLATWRHGMPAHHMAQVQGQMWVLGREWIDFCSYDPRMQNSARHLKLYRQRVQRDEAYITQLQAAVLDFLEEVQAEVNTYLELEAFMEGEARA